MADNDNRDRRDYRRDDSNGDRRTGGDGQRRHGSAHDNSDRRRDGGRDDRRDDRRRSESRGDSRGGNRGDRRPTGARYGQRSDGFKGGPRTGPVRQGFREERLDRRAAEPDLPEGLDLADLDPMIRQDLRVLSKDNAEAVGKHMLMAAELVDDAPELALQHARAAKNRAGRVAIAREVNGVTAYRAGEWKEALAELRAARRIGGGPGMLALMADCERGLGRPEKAIELSRSEEAGQLDRESAVEFGIVVAGARHDMGQHESALLTLERLNPDRKDHSFSGIRLAYAFANALEQAGRVEEARDWFKHVLTADEEEWTDAAERLEALD